MLSEKKTFSQKQYGFFTTLADPPPPGLAKDHRKYGFFSEPFPKVLIVRDMTVLTDRCRIYDNWMEMVARSVQFSPLAV